MFRVFLVAFALAFTIESEARAQPAVGAGEIQVGPITANEQYQGISIDIPVTAFLHAETSADGLFVKIRAVSDLHDLQQKIGSIVDTIPLPTDNCRSYSANNPVVTISGKQLRISGSPAVLSLSGEVKDWDCRENPIPNSKIEWRIQDFPFGIKTKVPVVVTWPGSPIKNLLVTQPVDVSLPVILHVIDGQTAELQIGTPNIKLGGQYAAITNSILSVAGININTEAKKALDITIDPSMLRQSVPDQIKKLTR